MYNKFINWCNENNVQVTWFLIGTLLTEMLYETIKLNYWALLINSLCILGLWFTRDVKFKESVNG